MLTDQYSSVHIWI